MLGLGRPPAACAWLPPDWPAQFFPLGRTASHREAWRALVRSVVVDGRDTVPADHPQYGWLTLTRATRLFAHHRGVIPYDRVVAPLPASRDEARREVVPLLDGLVSGRPRNVPHGREKQKAVRSVAKPTPVKAGRPPNELKHSVVAYVRELRSKQTPWKEIPDAVFREFKIRYTTETLRGYLKSG